jgi:inorganic phosphate transporter, PiT family
VSTTHTVAGAVSGVGVTNRGTTTNWSIFGRMAVAWLVTLLFAGVVSYLVWHLAALSDRRLSVVIMTVIVVALVATLVVAIRRAPKAADIDAETRQEEEVEIPLRPGAGTMIGSGTVPASEEVRAAERRRVEQPL